MKVEQLILDKQRLFLAATTRTKRSPRICNFDEPDYSLSCSIEISEGQTRSIDKSEEKRDLMQFRFVTGFI